MIQHSSLRAFLIASTLCAFYPLASPIVPAQEATASAEQQNHEPLNRTRLPSVKEGTWKRGVFDTSEIFPGTTREYSVYIPAAYDPSAPAALMVFQDGNSYANQEGNYRVPILVDNLIARKEMPVTIVVFIAPGTIPAELPGAANRSTRSFEYDSMGGRYAKFLTEELLPKALDGLQVSSDPKMRAIGGSSSGGIAAFTVAWEQPDQFGRVLSNIGSYTDIRGGWAYPGLIRKTARSPKPLKVYLQDGVDDLNNLFGSWPLGNQDMAIALNFAGYTHHLEMTPGGHSGVEGGKVFTQAMRWLWKDEVKKAAESSSEGVAENPKPKWEPHPDAIRQEGVPRGELIEFKDFESKIFPQTVRDWSIYVPAQVDPKKPSALMVFQDGHDYVKENGRWRVPIVFDNLIARGDMPPTIAVFINPGHNPRRPRPQSPWRVTNRGYEYDSLGGRYAQFLVEEILPEVRKTHAISDDPNMRAMCGASSGGISSFTVAWERPDQFRKVLTTIGSFTNLRGGNVYPSLIRKTEPKPLRIYMADTSGDLDNPYGHWPTSNQMIASALGYMGYDLRFDWDEGYGHNSDHGGKLFPEAVKWLWREEAHQPKLSTKDDLRGDMTLLKLLIPGEGWKVDTEGNESIRGITTSHEGRKFALRLQEGKVVEMGRTGGSTRVIASVDDPTDLVASNQGFLYVTQANKNGLVRIHIETGEVLPLTTSVPAPKGVALSPDGGTLVISEGNGAKVWMGRVRADGSTDAEMPVMELQRPIDPDGDFAFNEPPPYQQSAGGAGIAVDREGRYYVASTLGIQVFDPTGRRCGLIEKPVANTEVSACKIGGKDSNELLVEQGGKVYRRKLGIAGEKP